MFVLALITFAVSLGILLLFLEWKSHVSYQLESQWSSPVESSFHVRSGSYMAVSPPSVS